MLVKMGKLLKYELRATSRTMLPLYVAFIAITLLGTLILKINIKAIPSGNESSVMDAMGMAQYVLLGGYIGAICMIVAATVITIIIRFYTNMLGDEGYLTHTLPVPVSYHMISKFIVAFMWMALATIFALGACVIMVQSFRDGGNIITEIRGSFVSAGLSFRHIPIIVICGITSLSYGITQLYVSMAIGQLFTQHRRLGAIVAYILTSTVAQIFSFVPIFSGTVPLFQIVSGNFLGDFYTVVNRIFLFSILIQLILTVLSWITTWWLMSKRLNLE